MKWKLAFYSGGVGTFLMGFLNLVKDARRQLTEVGPCLARPALPPSAALRNLLLLANAHGPQVPMAEARLVMAEAQVAEAILAAPPMPGDPTVVWISDAVILGEGFDESPTGIVSSADPPPL